MAIVLLVPNFHGMLENGRGTPRRERDGPVHNHRFRLVMCRKVQLEEVRAAANVVVKKEKQVTFRRLHANVPGGTGAAPQLFDDAKRTGWPKLAERLSGAVG